MVELLPKRFDCCYASEWQKPPKGCTEAALVALPAVVLKMDAEWLLNLYSRAFPGERLTRAEPGNTMLLMLNDRVFMLKTAMITLFILSLGGCGTAPAPTVADARPFSVISEQADPVASSLTMLIKVTGPATQQNVKSIVESIIANRKGDYRHILVKSYAEGTPASDVPFAVSRLEDGLVTHRFNSMAETQRIPTH